MHVRVAARAPLQNTSPQDNQNFKKLKLNQY